MRVYQHTTAFANRVRELTAKNTGRTTRRIFRENLCGQVWEEEGTYAAMIQRFAEIKSMQV